MGSKGRGNADGVEFRASTEAEIDVYRSVEQVLATLRVPQLLHDRDDRSRLFVVGLDGTGNDMHKDDPGRHSNVARIYQQIAASARSDVAGGYVPGTFTQDNLLTRYVDGVSGFTFDQRVETAYWQLCEQAAKWLHENPEIEIRVLAVGFSRGAEQAAALTRVIHERGILDPHLAEVQMSSREPVVLRAKYHGEPLIPPGQTLQAALLFDPVSTGVRDHDRRLSASVVSALQLTARDERRNAFPASQLLPPGLSREGTSLNAELPGVHSTLGNTYLQNGLGTLSHNLGVAYINRFSERPLLQKLPEPEDPAMYVVHRSDQHSVLWSTPRDPDSPRQSRDDLAPRAACRPRAAPVCRQPDPVDPELLRRAEALMPEVHQDRAGSVERSQVQAIFERLARAAMHGDRAGMQSALGEWQASPEGQAATRAGQAYLEHEQRRHDPDPAHRQYEQPVPALP